LYWSCLRATRNGTLGGAVQLKKKNHIGWYGITNHHALEPAALKNSFEKRPIFMSLKPQDAITKEVETNEFPP
jgi:hypothetical protein